MKTRRDFLKMTIGAVLLADVASLFGADNNFSRASWKIGICDWDVRATGRLTSFVTARELGFEGVQVSYQIEGEDALAVKANRQTFLETAAATGIDITSFCIGTLNNRPLATTPEAIGWVEDCIDAMVEMSVEQVLIPFFGNADLTRNTDHFQIVVEKFKYLASVAEKNNKILSIESTLSAEEHMKMIEAVGSNALKVYYDVCNGVLYNKNYDIFHEMELLGRHKLISQIHFKENRQRLGEGNIDFEKVCSTLEQIGYDNWIVVEGSTSGEWAESQMANAQFIKNLIGR